MYNNKLLLVLVAQPLTNQTFKRFGVDTKYNKWKIVHWNFLPMLDKRLDKIYSGKGNRLKKNKNYIKINSFSSLIKEYKKIPKKFFYINQIGSFYFTSLLDRYLSFHGGIKIQLVQEQNPIFNVKRTEVIKNLIPNHKSHLLKKIYYYLLSKAKQKVCLSFLQKKPKIIFATCFRSYLDLKQKFKDSKIFKINSYDFDIYIKSKNKKPSNKNNILFIDQVMEGNFDYRLGKGKASLVKKDNYWENLEILFNKVIQKFPSYKFFIASHHRRNEKNLPVKKKFIFDKTRELIRNSKLVFCHNSNAINFAVLYMRPIILIDMDLFKFNAYEVVENIRSFSRELGLKIININKDFKIDKSISIKKLQKFDKKKYMKFAHYYIGFPGLKSQGRWEKILKELESI